MADSSREFHPVTNTYHGSEKPPEHARGIKAYEAALNREKTVGTLDDLYMIQLENASKNNRRSVNILDIGSGDAMVYRELFNKDAFPKTKEYLRQHPDIVLNLIGLTDAHNTTEFYKEEILSKPDLIPNVNARNIKYTLTANPRQSLHAFLDHENISSVDLVTSVMSLTYLGLNNFERTMRDAIDALREHGGMMIVAGFADQVVPGFVDADIGMPLQELDVRNIDQGDPAYKRAIKGDNSHLFNEDKKIDAEDELRGIKKAESVLQRIGAMSSEDLETSDQEYQENTNRYDYPVEEALAMKMGWLQERVNTHAEKRIVELNKQKKSIVEKIVSPYQSRLNTNIQSSCFQLIKN